VLWLSPGPSCDRPETTLDDLCGGGLLRGVKRVPDGARSFHDLVGRDREHSEFITNIRVSPNRRFGTGRLLLAEAHDLSGEFPEHAQEVRRVHTRHHQVVVVAPKGVDHVLDRLILRRKRLAQAHPVRKQDCELLMLRLAHLVPPSLDFFQVQVSIAQER
jgi:hypothetical protein